MIFKYGRKLLRGLILTSVVAGGLYLTGCSQPAAYGPPSCDSDEDCKNISTWYNHCSTDGDCEHLETDGGTNDGGKAE